MRKNIEEPERLDRFLQEIRDKSQDFKALVIKLCYEINDVERVSGLTNVPVSTIYDWLEEWNKKKNIP
ncbi:MAG TPA: helix-turn-helix domain-containing protein [Thermodesulfobacteriota bacterium]|nr:helix-turn-helix domain-containing protein [Thermodesulfobacteriota bacterium]